MTYLFKANIVQLNIFKNKSNTCFLKKWTEGVAVICNLESSNIPLRLHENSSTSSTNQRLRTDVAWETKPRSRKPKVITCVGVNECNNWSQRNIFIICSCLVWSLTDWGQVREMFVTSNWNLKGRILIKLGLLLIQNKDVSKVGVSCKVGWSAPPLTPMQAAV